MAEHFQNQARFWGISPSHSFVGEPETNGVIERLLRTLKEQAIHGRVFQTIDELRDALRDFAARYNAEWLIEKNGYRSPTDARVGWLDATLSHAAYAPACPGNRVRYIERCVTERSVTVSTSPASAR